MKFFSSFRVKGTIKEQLIGVMSDPIYPILIIVIVIIKMLVTRDVGDVPSNLV